MANELYTPWGETLDRSAPLPEYPRPQLKRESYLNLNGLWNYTITRAADGEIIRTGEICVPFAPECLLSGVGHQLRGGEVLTYERTVAFPEGFLRERTLLHFGAVDQIADVYWNGVHVAHHEGGYLPFTAEVTAALSEGENRLKVVVTDDLKNTPHAYGKQRYKRGGIWYTATSGIWQTVWMESVADNYIERIELTPDFDARRLYWKVHAKNPQGAHVVVRKDGVCIAEDWDYHSDNGEGWSLICEEDFRPWSPEDPFLYTVEVDVLGGDHVESYFAMRKFSTMEHNGRIVMALNNKPYFHNGLLDQGYWSDGLYTAPSDEALIYDIAEMKRLGFSMLRKHIKIEPLRWYYHCDRLGMLVWQDMVNGGGSYNPAIISAPLVTGIHISDKHHKLFGRGDAAGREQYERDLVATVEHLYNCPCIALWVPFNEGWGQFDAFKYTQMLWDMDPTRLVDSASGWHDQGGGDVKSLHIYFKRVKMKHDGSRALALTEFGGYSLVVKGHIHGREFGYRLYHDQEKWQKAYLALYEEQVLPLIAAEGLSAAVYTEVSDVEDELNGILTFDRRVCKLDEAAAREINGKLKFM